MITHRNSLDICPGGVPLFIRLSQYDSSFTLIFDLFSHKGTFTVESGTTARFRELKPDGNAISIDATISGTTVTLAPSQANAQQMTAIAGNCKCELSLFKGDKELNTANFTLLIEKAVIDKDTLISDSVLRELVDVIDRTDELLAAARAIVEAVDPTLSISGKPADAKATGDAIAAIEPGLSDEAKTALLACFQNVGWINNQGQSYYDALEDALYERERKYITALFDCGNDTPYDDWNINALKKYLTVKFIDDQTETILSDEDYDLSGNLNSAVSSITITYLNQYRTTISVNVIVGRYLTINDVESSLGYSNFAVSENGTMSCDSNEIFSAVILKPSIKHIRYSFVSATGNVFWNVLGKISQQNSSFYGTDSSRLYQFAEGADKYTATQTGTVSYTSNTPDITLTGKRVDQKIEGGYLIITGNTKYSIQTNGIECLGKWGNQNTQDLLNEVKVYE